jgi:hypothetical protein
MQPSGEYRCPNCLRAGKPGIRFGVEIIGIPISHGMLMIDLNGLNYNVYCLHCLREGVEGLDGKIGLVAEQIETGWRVLK